MDMMEELANIILQYMSVSRPGGGGDDCGGGGGGDRREVIT